MTRGAVLIARICEIVRGGLRGDAAVDYAECSGAVVAFQADGHNRGTPQQFLIH